MMTRFYHLKLQALTKTSALEKRTNTPTWRSEDTTRNWNRSIIFTWRFSRTWPRSSSKTTSKVQLISKSSSKLFELKS